MLGSKEKEKAPVTGMQEDERARLTEELAVKHANENQMLGQSGSAEQKAELAARQKTERDELRLRK